MTDLIVIGVGPSGMLAAGRAAELGASVTLLEKNPSLGKKLIISGGGRCNFTNAEYDIRVLADSNLSGGVQCHLAMLNGQLVALLARRAGDTAFRDAAARYVGCDARPEVREEVQAWLLTQLLPAGQAQPTPKALGQWWPFLASSGLERGTRLALAQRLLDARVGPWQQEGSLAFTDRVGAALVVRDGKGFSVKEPDLWHCWAQELARRDESAELVGLLEPRWQELLGQVRGPQDVTQATARQPLSAWLDDPAVLEAWLRGVAARPDKLGELAQR